MNLFVETVVDKSWSRKVSSLTIYLFSEGTQICMLEIVYSCIPHTLFFQER